MLSKNTTYRVWLAEWFDVYKKPALQPCSLVKIEICIRLHMPDFIKDLPLIDIDPFTIQKALNTIPSTRTRLYTYDVYNESLRRAKQLKLIIDNPVDNVDKIKHTRKIGEALSPIQLKSFIQSINETRCKNIFLFYLYTGVRRQEALDCKWSDIDFIGNIIHINGTKTILSKRTIPLLPELKKLLLKMKRNEDDYLFHYTGNYISKEFHSLVPSHKLHDLRHTFATRCLESGISIKVVQKWLGHSRIETTSAVYTHVLDDFNKTEAIKFKLFSE